MKRIFFLASVCITMLIMTTVKAQNETANKFFYGGGLGFSIESNYWMLNVSPLLGYRFTPSFSGGVSVLYAHESYKKRNPDYTINSYGGGAFLRYDLGGSLMKDKPFSIFFQADYEGRQEDIKFKSEAYKDYSEFQNRMYLGAGYYQPLGGRMRAFFIISLDVLHLGSDDDIRPLIRAGVEF